MVGPDESGDLKVLRLRLRPSSTGTAVVFELKAGGEVRGTAEAQLEDLGWRTSAQGVEPRDPTRHFHPPDWLGAALSGLVRSFVGPDEILWLRFSHPSGGLGMLPWERWLAAEVVGSPVVRWPYFDFVPARIGLTTEVAICATVAQSKQAFALPALLAPVVREILDSSLQARFHVFVDAALEDEVRFALESEVEAGSVRIVDPHSAESFGAAPRSYDLSADRDQVDSPWLRWMLTEGLPRFDLVLFLAHGFLADGRGALAFAESPLRNSDRSWARFVGSHQLRVFLDSCGAAMLALISPPDNFNFAGLLALADEVARDRPGAVLVHDLGRAQPEPLAPTLSLLLGKGTGPLPSSEAQSLYALPEQVGASRGLQGTGSGSGTRTAADPAGVQVPAGTTEGALESYTLAVAGEPAADEGVRWVATSQRILERHTGDLLRTGGGRSEVAQAARTGRAEALKFVADLLKDVPKG